MKAEFERCNELDRHFRDEGLQPLGAELRAHLFGGHMSEHHQDLLFAGRNHILDEHASDVPGMVSVFRS